MVTAKEIQDSLDKLRTAKALDIIARTDHNDLVDTMKLIGLNVIDKSSSLKVVDVLPSSPVVGQMVILSTDNKMYYWNGSEWIFLPDPNITHWGGQALTPRDISLDLQKLDVALSSRATGAILNPHPITHWALDNSLSNLANLLQSIELKLDILNAIEIPTSGADGVTDVGVASVQIDADQECRAVRLQSLSTNTGKIYVGFTNPMVVGRGSELDKGDSMVVQIDNVNKLYAISDMADQKLLWLCVV